MIWENFGSIIALLIAMLFYVVVDLIVTIPRPISHSKLFGLRGYIEWLISKTILIVLAGVLVGWGEWWVWKTFFEGR